MEEGSREALLKPSKVVRQNSTAVVIESGRPTGHQAACLCKHLGGISSSCYGCRIQDPYHRKMQKNYQPGLVALFQTHCSDFAFFRTSKRNCYCLTARTTRGSLRSGA